MPQYRINVKGAPKHLQKQWSDKLSRLFSKYMEESEKLRQAKLQMHRNKKLHGIGG